MVAKWSLRGTISQSQEPFIQNYSGSAFITLPVAPKVITDVWIMQGAANPLYLLKSDYTVNGAIVTTQNPVFSDGMTIKINYTA